ncbi:MAG: hypothetical protein FJ146_07720 [Deltaproteobacteria bacterium]|nr:hypothetical protein [Deltaproteobacteria bacterium]
MATTWRVVCASAVLVTLTGCGNTSGIWKSRSDKETATTGADGSALAVHADSPAGVNLSLATISAAASDWCSSAVAIAKAQSATHQSQWDAICSSDGSAKATFADLLSKPYTGNGNPTPVALAPIVGRNGTVSYLFGIAIKTPISARHEFDQVLIKQGDIDNESNLIRFQGANPVSVNITPVTPDTSPKWIRGWKIDETSVQRVVVVNVRTSYSFVADHYDLGSDRFLYLSTIDQSRETMKDYQIMMAGLDVGGSGYVIMIGHITVDDHGYSSIAKNTLQAQVQKSIQFVYKNAAATH